MLNKPAVIHTSSNSQKLDDSMYAKYKKLHEREMRAKLRTELYD
jgi:hypothetical protein